MSSEETMRGEYDRETLGSGVRGKYLSEYEKAHNVVVLEPQVAEAFPTDEAVNTALRELLKVAQAVTEKQRREP